MRLTAEKAHVLVRCCRPRRHCLPSLPIYTVAEADYFNLRFVFAIVGLLNRKEFDILPDDAANGVRPSLALKGSHDSSAHLARLALVSGQIEKVGCPERDIRWVLSGRVRCFQHRASVRGPSRERPLV